jgi:NADPH:quinone reductase-like Zn-dependent oxidoreductase
MKAVVCTGYGPPEVLQIRDLPRPVPKVHEVCIKNFATSVTGSDVLIRNADMPFFMKVMFRLMIGIRRPRNPVLGLVFAGEVESVGKQVQRFKPGDQVSGFTGFSFGAYAEYVCISEKDSKRGCIEIMHPRMSHEQAAAAAYAGVLAPFFLEKGHISPGQKVLVYGASGAFGSTSVQLARNLGAEVTAVCSTGNKDLVLSLGAAKVIDYTKEDITGSEDRYDFILDAVPNGKIDRKKLKSKCKKVLAPNGIYISIDDGAPALKSEYLARINTLFEAGNYQVVIDRTYPLEQIVEAHRYVDSGRKKGNVVITIAHDVT